MAKKSAELPAIATAGDVARMAKVSQSAVSRAFTPGASVAPDTRKRILEAAEAVGYQPDMIARSLMSGRSNIVGVGVGNIVNPFLSATLDLLTIKLAEVGLRLLLFSTDDSSITQVPAREVLQYRLDAMVLLASALSDELAGHCARARVPVILYNRQAQAGAPVSSVSGDNITGGRSLAAFLCASGHSRFAFISGIAASLASQQRGSSFGAYVSEQGHAPPIVECGFHTYEGAAAAARQLLLRADRPDAIFCANDMMALAAIDVARSEFGLAVGRDISIVGFDDIAMARWPSFSLTTYAQSTARLVEETVAIIQSVRGGAEPIQTIIPGTLVVRNSARTPKVASWT
ncbi:substrate-binding domain-containing protein [Sphingomonas sp.]|jgi:LacI family transcriptional regulator|uniref:LacI family DNA-binding transcriptional regulator n=1 Tax=Sphingomonas sp. TaxID=28214 RepID=UPI002D7E7AD1|nr:substrate-binding domain-containing protein [Sphingomonas sp.]HEU0043520.1 substrate-binding domain-containing protein [Sphingomonas sp.]